VIYWVITVLSLIEVTSTLMMKAACVFEALVPKYHITVCHNPDIYSQLIPHNLTFKYRHSLVMTGRHFYDWVIQ